MAGHLRPASLTSTSDDMVNDDVSLERLGNSALPFCEDVVLWEAGGVAIFSSDPSRDIYNPFAAEGDPAKAASGRLMAYPLSGGDVYDIAPGFEMHPLGVGVHRTQPILAVANLTAAGASVEIFRLAVEEGTVRATHVRSLAYPALATPNAVVPLSEDAVLVTNSFRYSAHYSKLLNTLETFLAIPGGTVLRLAIEKDKTTCDVVARGIALANGLALSDDGTVLAVAGCLTSNIHIYDVSPPLDDTSMAGRLRFRESIPAGFLVDNLRFVRTDTDHVFLACGHPSALDFTACAKSHGEKLCGTRAAVVRVGKSRGKRAGLLNALFTRIDPRVTTVFEDDGGVLGTGATACVDGMGGIIVTGLFDRRGPVRCAGVEV
jgi:sugar lactone lactonase YvrE